MMAYRRQIPVEFNHCDPAGIVFYPRYFEMVNSVVENFFGEALGYSFARMMAGRSGVPTVRIAADFRAPSRLGEVLGFELRVLRVGRASLGLRIGAGVAGEERMAVELTVVWLAPGGRPAPWPEEIRAALGAFAEAAA